MLMDPRHIQQHAGAYSILLFCGPLGLKKQGPTHIVFIHEPAKLFSFQLCLTNMQGRLYRNNVNINLNQVTNKIAYSTVEYVNWM